MRSWIQSSLLAHWQRKLISIVLAVVVWLIVNHTLTATKVFPGVPIRVIHLPPNKTIEGLQPNGLLSRRITLTLAGNKNTLDNLTPTDLEVVLDATDKPNEWTVMIGKNNLISLQPEVNVSKSISKVHYLPFSIHLTKLAIEKIPIVITQPIGEPPRDYIYLDVWPYHLTTTIKGPEDTIKRLKATGQKLTFNLNNISKADLDALPEKAGDEVSFFVPDNWKQIQLPALSDTPIEIDDPQAKALRIDFVRMAFFPLNASIPVNLFFPPEYRDLLNPTSISIADGGAIEKVNGLSLIAEPLYAKGVGRLFLDVVKDNLEISVIVTPKKERPTLDWSIQFINPQVLEDRYVSILLSDVSDEEIRDLPPTLREEYLRNRFRSYMNRFQLYRADQSKLELDIVLKGNTVSITDHDHSS